MDLELSMEIIRPAIDKHQTIATSTGGCNGSCSLISQLQSSFPQFHYSFPPSRSKRQRSHEHIQTLLHSNTHERASSSVKRPPYPPVYLPRRQPHPSMYSSPPKQQVICEPCHAKPKKAPCIHRVDPNQRPFPCPSTKRRTRLAFPPPPMIHCVLCQRR